MIERLTHGGKMVWAVDTGLEPLGLEASALVKQVRSPAWFYDGQWKSWTVQGVLEHRGTLWIFGPDQGEVLLQSWDPLPLEVEQKRVEAFFQGMSTAPAGSGPWLCLDHHRFLLLPEYFHRIRLGEVERWQAFGSPGAGETRDRDWRLGALLWRHLSGAWPYPENPGEEKESLRDRQRTLRLPPSAWNFPQLPAQAALALDRSLDFSWKEAGTWTQAALPSPLPAPSAGLPDGRIEKWMKKEDRKYRHNLWWRKNRLRALGWGAAALLLVLSAGGALVSLAFPPAPDPRTDRDIVQAYYDTLNSIQDRPLRELTRGSRDPVIQKEADEMARLFVFSELQIAQMGGPGVLSAPQWEQGGRQTLGNYQTLFGLTDLVLTQRPAPRAAPDEALWEARYRRWYSTQEQEGTRMKPREWDVREVDDLLTLRLTPQGWKILRIERKETPLSMDGLLP